MRTTIDIPDPMYRRLKARAATEGQTAKAMILRAVEQVLASKPASGKKLKAPVIASRQPGTMHLDNARIYDVISFP